jgi:hypothetical protein
LAGAASARRRPATGRNRARGPPHGQDPRPLAAPLFPASVGAHEGQLRHALPRPTP